ncbi:MAG: hypoxanthine phosphoribosyltransferase [Enterococcus sp.]|nr:hypoxanthine phosphoribosyltransferase [Enterococcus sp.]
MSETIGKVLITEEQIQQRAKEIAAQIDKDFKGQEILLVGTLKGAVMWMSEVMKHITVDCKIDFVIASSYGSATTSSGIIKIKKDVDTNIAGKNIIIVEDIVDTGNTLIKLKEHFLNMQPKSVKICSMLDKPSRREADLTIDYIGFEVENLFIVGYGLDFDQKYRDLPYISYLTNDEIEAE